MVRFENLADRFDVKSQSIKYLDVQKFAREFYMEANPFSKYVPQIDIKEVSLSNNQLMSELEKKQSAFQWIGDGDDKIKMTQVYYKLKDENPITKAALEPQRIRQYVIEYNKNLKKEVASVNVNKTADVKVVKPNI